MKLNHQNYFMNRITTLFLTLVFILSILFSGCQHQKCPAYMTKKEVEDMHKQASKANKKSRTRNKSLF